MSTFLVVAHQTAATAELRDALLARRQDDRRALFVLLAPATPVEKLLNAGEGTDISIAEKSLSAARQFLDDAGLDVLSTIVGDPDPMAAIENEYRRAGRTYDGIIVCTLPSGSSSWLDSNLLERARAVFEVPVQHVEASEQTMRSLASRPMVTISARLGSAGDAIARQVAERLGFSFYDWEITSAAAELAGVSPEIVAASERAQSLLERVLDRLSSTGLYVDDAPIGRLSSSTMSAAIGALTSRQYREFVERIVHELAARGGCVLVGHAGQAVLQDVPNVFKVLVGGSSAQRAQRVAADEGRSLKEAERLVLDSDDERKAFFRQTYGVDLLDSTNYDLCLNSDGLSVGAAGEIISRAFEARLGNPKEAPSKIPSERQCRSCGANMQLARDLNTREEPNPDDDGDWVCPECGERAHIVLKIPRRVS